MREWDMVIGDIIEEMDLFFLQEETGSNRVDWSITPSLIEKSSILVKGFKEISVCF